MKIQGMTLDGHKIILKDGVNELRRRCPRCNRKKALSEFGLRKMTGKKEIRLQAECTECRGEA